MFGNGKYETAMEKLLDTTAWIVKADVALVLRGTAYQVDDLDRTLREDARTLGKRLIRFADATYYVCTPPCASSLVNDIIANTAVLKVRLEGLNDLIRTHLDLPSVNRFKELVESAV